MTLGYPQSERTRIESLVGDMRQLASIRQVELRDGAECGVRALVFSTGGGLDFWVFQDRSMDIGLLSWRGTPIAWHHPDGFSAPALRPSFADSGRGVQRTLGGFLVTCGLDNVRQPRGDLPLHGSLPVTPARLLTCYEDWSSPTPILVAEGEIVSSHMGRASFRMRRRIEAPIAGSTLTISDWAENIGPEPAELMVLYHMNFGFPLVAPGTRIFLNGKTIPFKEPVDSAIRQSELKPDCHSSSDENERFLIEVHRDCSGSWPGITMAVSGNARALPYVQFWRDPRPRRNVLAIEPVNCDRAADGTSTAGTTLAPGETWSSSLGFDFSNP